MFWNYDRILHCRLLKVPRNSKGETDARWNREAAGRWAGTVQLSVREQRLKPERESRRMAEWLLRSLKVSVNLEAVVARVGNSHVSIRGEGQTLGAVQRVCWGVDVGEEGACAVKHLKSKTSISDTGAQSHFKASNLCFMTILSFIRSLFITIMRVNCGPAGGWFNWHLK